jgi:8-oxo-dGTP diphosphatase
MTDVSDTDFVGAKVAMTCGPDILVYLRDEKPGLAWASMWDLPGGGREGSESPQDCVLRELNEEFGLLFPPERLIWSRRFPSMVAPDRRAWFFVAKITPDEISRIRFGDEGQSWEMMQVQVFLDHPKAIPEMQTRLKIALSGEA